MITLFPPLHLGIRGNNVRFVTKRLQILRLKPALKLASRLSKGSWGGPMDGLHVILGHLVQTLWSWTSQWLSRFVVTAKSLPSSAELECWMNVYIMFCSVILLKLLIKRWLLYLKGDKDECQRLKWRELGQLYKSTVDTMRVQKQ